LSPTSRSPYVRLARCLPGDAAPLVKHGFLPLPDVESKEPHSNTAPRSLQLPPCEPSPQCPVSNKNKAEGFKEGFLGLWSSHPHIMVLLKIPQRSSRGARARRLMGIERALRMRHQCSEAGDVRLLIMVGCGRRNRTIPQQIYVASELWWSSLILAENHSPV
jgi:hypothetical protein